MGNEEREVILAHVTTTVEHIQLILETIQAMARLGDESVLVLTRSQDVILFPDLEGPVIIDDAGTIMGDARFALKWSDDRTAEEVFEAVAALERPEEDSLRGLGIEPVHENPTADRPVEFCNLPPSEN